MARPQQHKAATSGHLADVKPIKAGSNEHQPMLVCQVQQTDEAQVHADVLCFPCCIVSWHRRNEVLERQACGLGRPQ